MPKRRAVLITRQAISPRLAMRIFLNMVSALYPAGSAFVEKRAARHTRGHGIDDVRADRGRNDAKLDFRGRKRGLRRRNCDVTGGSKPHAAPKRRSVYPCQRRLG